MVRFRGLDHVVFTVADAERSIEWYGTVLGAEPERVEAWRRGEVPFPSVRLTDTVIIDLFTGERSGTNVDHIALVVDDDVDELAASGRFEVLEGPARRWGAQGDGRSIYVPDPDGNVIELRNYPA